MVNFFTEDTIAGPYGEPTGQMQVRGNLEKSGPARCGLWTSETNKSLRNSNQKW